MRRTEINEIIRQKIEEVEDSEPMKDFLIEIIESEIDNIDQSIARYSNEYKQLATKQSNKEVD